MRGRWKEHAHWPQAGVRCGGAVDAEHAAVHTPLTFVRLGRRAWKGAQGPLPSQGISILSWSLLRGPIATTFLCCGPKVSWPGDLPGPQASLWSTEEGDKAQRRQPGESPP